MTQYVLLVISQVGSSKVEYVLVDVDVHNEGIEEGYEDSYSNLSYEFLDEYFEEIRKGLRNGHCIHFANTCDLINYSCENEFEILSEFPMQLESHLLRKFLR